MAGAVKKENGRRQRGSLSRDEVVEAALAIADAEGLEALSMPRLAQRLGCGVMTIYGYVADKEDLLDAVAQLGLRDLRLERPIPARAEEILGAWGAALRQALLLHPSLSGIFLTRAVIGPGIFRGVEALLGPLEAAGQRPDRAVHSIYAVLIFTTGFVAWEMPRTRRQSQAAYATAWRREFAALDPEQFPKVATVLDDLAQVAGEDQFQRGLRALVAGLS